MEGAAVHLHRSVKWPLWPYAIAWKKGIKGWWLTTWQNVGKRWLMMVGLFESAIKTLTTPTWRLLPTSVRLHADVNGSRGIGFDRNISCVCKYKLLALFFKIKMEVVTLFLSILDITSIHLRVGRRNWKLRLQSTTTSRRGWELVPQTMLSGGTPLWVNTHHPFLNCNDFCSPLKGLVYCVYMIRNEGCEESEKKDA